MDMNATIPAAAIAGAPEDTVIKTLENIFHKAARLEELKRKELLRASEVEELFGITKDTLNRLRCGGTPRCACQLAKVWRKL